MPTKTNGPLMEDYKRAIRAAKWAGWSAVRVEIGGSAIVLLKDDSYLEKLAQSHPPAPSPEPGPKQEAKLTW